MQEMLFGWRGSFVAALNAEWDSEDATDADLAAFVKSFEHVYCFGPLDIQACTFDRLITQVQPICSSNGAQQSFTMPHLLPASGG